MASITILSWNVDGLNAEHGLNARAAMVCEEVIAKSPDVAFFQELVPENFIDFVCKLSEKGYDCYCERSEQQPPYFNASFLKSTTFPGKDVVLQTVDFKTSQMGRHLILLTAKHTESGILFTFANSHFESQQIGGKERVKQLEAVRKLAVESKHPFIFAGDTNLRDSEVTAALRKDFFDVWESCGKPKEAQFTWDLSRNDTLSFGGATPKCRFDRAFFNRSTEFESSPSNWQLLGMTKQSGLFPSDHFGITWNHTIRPVAAEDAEKTSSAKRVRDGDIKSLFSAQKKK